METAPDHRLLVLEKEEALERYHQSQMLVEKLEEELKNLKEMLPINESRHIFTLVQMEYIELINSMKNKNGILTEKLNDDYRIMCEKDDEIRRLQDDIDRLSKMLDHKMVEIEDSKNELRCEREKFRSLERDIVDVEKKLFHLETKYNSLNVFRMEEERDELERKCLQLTENRDKLADTLKNNYKKINSLDDKLARVNKYSAKLTKERDSLIEKNTAALKNLSKVRKLIRNCDTKIKKAMAEVFQESDLLLMGDGILTLTRIPTKQNDEIVFNRNHQEQIIADIVDCVNSCQKTCYFILSTARGKVEENRRLRSEVEKLNQQYVRFSRDFGFNSKIELRRWKRELSCLMDKFQNRILHLKKKCDRLKHENVETAMHKGFEAVKSS